jgi:hypothetical protein
MLTGETERRATSNLRVISTAFEGNVLLRSLWPSCAWDSPRRQAKKWNDKEIILPREQEYPDPSVFAIGVGGAITGARPNVQIKDDLISVEAANSATVMQTAIEWHTVSRALLDEYEKDSGKESLEFIIGTRWAVYDLYSHIIDNDPSVDVEIRAILEDSKPIWPERFDGPRIDQLMREYGSMFYLLYMNTAANPELTDFNEEAIRAFIFTNDAQALEFTEDERDHFLIKRLERDGEESIFVPPPRGQRLTTDTWEQVFGRGRGEYLRLKYA